MARSKVIKTPTVLQMEAAECGAASLGIILAHFGRFVPLEELRDECGVSRDGSKASNVLKAARVYNMKAKGYRKSPKQLREEDLAPAIIHWNFNHFLVLEGFGEKGWGRKRDRVAYLNDPAHGRRTVGMEQFGESFTGVVLVPRPDDDFKPGGEKPALRPSLERRLSGSRDGIIFLLIVSLALVVPGLVLPTLARVFVDDVLLADKRDWLGPVLLGMGLSAMVRGALVWLKQHYLLRMFTKLTVTSSAKFLWHVVRLPVHFFLARFPGDIATRVMLNDSISLLLSGRLASSALDLLMIAFYGLLMLVYDPALTLVGVLIAASNLAVLRFLARRRKDDSQRLQLETGKLMGVSMGGLHIIETIKAGGTESDFFAKWAGHFAKIQNATQDLGRSTLILGATPVLLSALNNAAILTFGGLRVMGGEMTVGMLVAFQTLMASFLLPVRNLVNLGSQLQEVGADLRRLDDVLDHPPAPGTSAEASDKAPVKFDGHVELKGITFGYAKHAPPLISDFSLKLTPGFRVALVGGSGSGKSTIAKLVAGLYQPWEGEVLFDDRPRTTIPMPEIQQSVSMVDQSIVMFEGPLRDNLTMWDPSVPEADIIRAAKDAVIHDDIVSREGGYDGWVEEGGRNFSGGQRQRLEIARALVRNPSILLLDEATSALDPKTEKRIDDNLRRRGCTCIIVAHRLSTIRDADEIIVLDQGLVIERGTHEELLELEGHYAGLMGAS